MCQFSKAFETNCHKLGGVKSQKFILSHSSGAQKSEIIILAGYVLLESLEQKLSHASVNQLKNIHF